MSEKSEVLREMKLAVCLAVNLQAAVVRRQAENEVEPDDLFQLFTVNLAD